MSDTCGTRGDTVASDKCRFTAAADGNINHEVHDDSLHLHAPVSLPTMSA